MLARYREAVDTVLQYRESKHIIIKQAVIALIPKMAAFAPEKFALSYLDTCTSHLLRVLSTSLTERGTAFSALGAMATALSRSNQARDLVRRLPDMTREMCEAFASKVCYFVYGFTTLGPLNLKPGHLGVLELFSLCTPQ